MTVVEELKANMTLPVIGAPLFIISNPKLVIEQCRNGVIGSFPALNARPQEQFEVWLNEIETTLASLKEQEPERRIAPYAVNLIVHPTNERLQDDLGVCVKHRVPIVITSLHAPTEVVKIVHDYGGLVFHDVTTVRHARKAIEAGVDGLILVCAGAGGHAGATSPFALVPEIRRFYDGPIALSGSVASGQSILTAEVLGADFAYVGTKFIAATEANVPDAYQQMVLDSAAADVVYTSAFTGVAGNYLKPSITAAGLDPDHLAERDSSTMDWNNGGAKAWKDIWGSGQGVGQIDAVEPAASIIGALAEQYHQHKALVAQRLGE
ncbi:NAD(P)H-dependent flavin oxidoreductase [Auritidibacter ignavus]|uniref:Nitronate monooxygenase family protein n=1 Tax=Auritidibacter ignavus TaxID=678932 RepID=A0AAJ6ALV2_9MICC|nr:nitronate monooxygenase family protein [Auritidibacter ignavus]NIH72021.1 nitronate monooxygenase [Auritidibacter ignavus]WGH92184.1 nitronate monooxygenase family protein [Auritidibacter ignavus]